jgi:Domain of unknown function (DUF4234)
MATAGMAAAAVPASGTATGALGKVRSPVTVILLSIITLGIYAIVWQYMTFQEMKDHSGEGVGGTVGLLLAIFIGIVNVFLMPSEVAKLYERAGEESPVSAVTGCWILLPLIGGFIWLFKTQGALNKYWEARA